MHLDLPRPSVVAQIRLDTQPPDIKSASLTNQGIAEPSRGRQHGADLSWLSQSEAARDEMLRYYSFRMDASTR
jgi:hypothetical protein